MSGIVCYGGQCKTLTLPCTLVQSTVSISAVRINPLRSSDAYTCHWLRYVSLVQIMACRLVGAKPWSWPRLKYCQFNTKETFLWDCNRNSYIQENPFENVVWQMASILSRFQCAKKRIVAKHTPHVVTILDIKNIILESRKLSDI